MERYEFLGLEVIHPFEIVTVSYLEIIEKNNMQFQWLGNDAERWEVPNLAMQPLKQIDDESQAKIHAFTTQIQRGVPGYRNTLRQFTIPAWQIYNNRSVIGFPSPSTTAELTGGETEVGVSFSSNISQAHVDGFKRRFFTFEEHDKLYLLDNLGVSAGGRTGTMTFTPNAQHAVDSGAVINFINPLARWALAQGFPPVIRTDANGFWRCSVDLVELWETVPANA